MKKKPRRVRGPLARLERLKEAKDKAAHAVNLGYLKHRRYARRYFDAVQEFNRLEGAVLREIEKLKGEREARRKAKEERSDDPRPSDGPGQS